MRRTPQALACCDPTSRLSYVELNARANQIARHLLACRIGAQHRVGLCLARSCDFLAALLGIIKAGAIYVPLDPHYPPAYLQRILSDARPHRVLSSGDLIRSLGEGVTTICVEEVGLETRADDNPGIPVHPGQVAYIAYTSGSTGTPKGVMTPRAPANPQLPASPVGAYPLRGLRSGGAEDSSVFVVSIKELLAGLLAGNAQVFVDDPTLNDMPKLIEVLEHHG